MECQYGRKSGAGKWLKRFLIYPVVCLCLCASAFALDATVVDASALNIRTETNTDCDVVTKVKGGATLTVTGRFDDWYSVQYGEKSGYVSGKYLKFDAGVEVANTFGVVTGSSVNVRNEADLESPVVTKLLEGTYVTVLDVEKDWYRIAFGTYTGYIHADYLSVNGLVYSFNEALASATTEEKVRAADAGVTDEVYVSDLRQQIVEYAKEFLGVPYVYGGATPKGFDCSGFTKYVYKHFGYTLNRSSAAQWENGTKISKDELLPGDLVYFTRGGTTIGHVGIYIGDGEFIHASSPGNDVCITPLSMNYYVERYAGARRIINE